MKRKLPKLGAGAILCLVGIAMVFPFVWMVASSFKPPSEIYSMPPTLLPRDPTLANYAEVLRTGHFLRWYLNSLLVGVSVTVSACFFCSLGGYALSKFRFPGKQAVFVVILGTMMVPMQMLIIPWYVMSVEYGLVNTYLGIMFPGLITAFGLFLMKQFIGTIPDSLVESARMDGANEFVIYWRIIVPLIKPSLAALAILTFLSNWDAFLWPLIVTDDVEMRTLPVGLQAFAGQFGREHHKVMAAATLVVIPVLAFFIGLQKHVLRGVAIAGPNR